MHRAAFAVIGRQTGGVQNALRDIVEPSEPAHAQRAHRTDFDAPVHPGDPDMVVAHGAHRARHVHSVRSEGVENEARARGIEAVGRRDRRIGIVAWGRIVVIGDRTAGAKRQRIGGGDEVVSVGRQVRRERRMVETRAVVDQRDEHGWASGRDGPSARQVDQAVMPRLEGVERVVRHDAQPGGRQAGRSRPPGPGVCGLVQP